MDKLGKSLHHYLKAFNFQFSLATVCKLGIRLLHILEALHDVGLVYNDLKPENVLLSKTGVIKICDFGSSKIIDEKGKNTPYIVSRYYRAPELILCITDYTVAIDVWAAGCILAELFLQTPFFRGKTEGDQLFKILETMGSFTPSEVKEFQSKVVFDTKLFESFPNNKRKNLHDIFHMVEDKKNLIDLLSKMLAYLPSKRITAEQAMAHPFFKDSHNSLN